MKISAIIPAYNASKFLERAVQSLIDTGYSPLEIIIIDDGSEDGTMDVAQHLQQLYPEKVVLFHHPNGVNHGVSASRNLGIRKSSGELICFLDADDHVFPYRFETAVSILKNDKAIDGVYELTCMEYKSQTDKNKWWDGSNIFGLSKPAAPEDVLQILLCGIPWHTSAILFRRSLLARTGLFHEGLNIAEDCHLWFRMACAGRIVAGDMSRPVSTYFRHADNTYQPTIERKKDMIKAMIDSYRWAYREKLPNNTMKIFQKGINNYIVNSTIITRESKRSDIAWEIIREVIKGRYTEVFTEMPFIKQLLALCKTILISRKIQCH